MSNAAKRDESNEIHITRIYNAPVKLVWEAWVDPKQVAQWWGPRGFTLTTDVKDVRTGGVWNYTMHGPDGTNYINKTKFLEVQEHSLLVYDHGGNDEQAPMFRVKVEFKAVGKKTQMNMRMILKTPEEAKQTRKFVKEVGGNTTWDRLGEYLDEQHHGTKHFIINRSFDAPITTMYKMWTDPDHFSKWLPPTGATMKFIRADIRPGGESFYRMDTAEGFTMYGKAHYKEMQPHSRIAYTQEFCDADGNLSRHPMLPTWPAYMETVVELTEEGPDATRVTVTWEPYEGATKEEIDMFMQIRAGMTQGWTGSFDKLEALLS